MYLVVYVDMVDQTIYLILLSLRFEFKDACTLHIYKLALIMMLKQR